MLINLILKLYRILFIATYLFLFVSLPTMIVFYGGTYEMTCNRTLQWAVGVLDKFTF